MKRWMFLGFLKKMAQRKKAGTTNHSLEAMNLSDTTGISLVMVVTSIQTNMQ